MITFTVEDIQAAYAATVLKPVRRSWAGFLDDDNILRSAGTHKLPSDFSRGCPLCALLTKRCGREKVRNELNNTDTLTELAIQELELTDNETLSFMCGVDGYPPEPTLDADVYAFGKKVAELLDPVTLPSV